MLVCLTTLYHCFQTSLGTPFFRLDIIFCETILFHVGASASDHIVSRPSTSALVVNVPVNLNVHSAILSDKWLIVCSYESLGSQEPLRDLSNWISINICKYYKKMLAWVSRLGSAGSTGSILYYRKRRPSLSDKFCAHVHAHNPRHPLTHCSTMFILSKR